MASLLFTTENPQQQLCFLKQNIQHLWPKGQKPKAAVFIWAAFILQGIKWTSVKWSYTNKFNWAVLQIASQIKSMCIEWSAGKAPADQSTLSKICMCNTLIHLSINFSVHIPIKLKMWFHLDTTWIFITSGTKGK